MALLVSLRSNFVADGVRYRAHPDGTVIPEKYRDHLPSSAQIMEELEEEKPIPRKFRRKVNATGQTKPKPAAAKDKDNPETLSQIGDKTPT